MFFLNRKKFANILLPGFIILAFNKSLYSKLSNMSARLNLNKNDDLGFCENAKGLKILNAGNLKKKKCYNFKF